ncbi:cobyrinate a,c-diamide synthase [Aphanothece hegewaldii]|uniref:cobyrinate a,c-diamide synthase n=1 Tax=Aphanothece hegewaldii TaxID=1521625 RepID=UPI001C62E66E|nr:cobyrinate a,c-diamide synthase [Aphanothece hegewaldii]
MIIAGERSGVGKTTITLAILSFLILQGEQVQSFKVGPDYIDPMFHTAITKRPCRNLDPILTSEDYVKFCFNYYSQNTKYALIEGVMGLFDGVKLEQNRDYASTAHIARILDLSVILVIDCSRLSGSVAAIARGYRCFDPRVKLAGVILNKVGSDRHLELLEEALLKVNMPIFGVFRRHDLITLRDRHLGLVPTQEIPDLNPLFEQLATKAQISLKWETLLPLLTVKRGFIPPSPNLILETAKVNSVKIGVAQDKAFSFYYQDNLDTLEKLGAELVFWSPIEEPSLPLGLKGLYFGGGFPEMFAQRLAENQTVREAVKKAIASGMPTYAECGGLMYLCEHLIDFEQKIWPMVGVLPALTQMGKSLTLGYRKGTAQQDSSTIVAGSSIWGHEFHRSQITPLPMYPLFLLEGLSKNAPQIAEGWTVANLHASYLHVHFGGYPAVAQRFLNSCLAFSLRVS